MGKRTIDQWTWDYWLLQMYVTFCYKIFYKKIYIRNLKNIPKNKPVILAPNHQNALMDALVLVCNTPFQIVFLARADIFKGKFIKHILNFLNILPIYRIRDGLDNVRKNDEIFEKTLQVFRNKLNPIGIFPEGDHGDKRKLRQLVKGIFRMALMAQEDYKNQPEVKIVPIGLDYGHYSNFRTSVFINIGSPIEVSEYYSQNEEDRVKSINDLKERLAAEISKLMIDIRSDEYYDLFMSLRTIYNRRMRELMHIKGNSLYDRFMADKKMIGILDESMQDDSSQLAKIDSLVKDYENQIKLLNIRDWIVEKEKFIKPVEYLKTLLLALLSPLYFLGLVNNLIPYKITKRVVKNIKDPQFHSSLKFVSGMVIFPVYFIILSVLPAVIIPGSLFSWLYIISIPLSGIFAYNFYIWTKKMRGKFRFLKYMRKSKGSRNNLAEQRKEIIALTDNLIIKSLKSGNHEVYK